MLPAPASLRSLVFASSILAMTCHSAPASAAARPALSPRDPEAALRGVASGQEARLLGRLQPGMSLRLRLDVDGAAMTVVLEPESVRAPGFKVVLQDRTGEHIVDPGPVRTVRGTIAEVPGSRVVGIVRETGLEASVQLPDAPSLRLAPAGRKRGRGDTDLYRLSPCDTTEEEAGGGSCAATGGARREKASASFATKAGVANCAYLGGCVADLLVDTDSAYYAASSGSATQVQANVENLVNTTNSRYEGPFSITHRITTVYIRSNPALDPYSDPSLTTDIAVLDAIRAEWPQQRDASDLVHLLTARTSFNSLRGAAWIAGACGFGIHGRASFSVGAGSDCARASEMIHELGHSWGSQHTCGIMSKFAPLDCNAPWCGTTLTDIPANRDRIAPLCLDLANQAPRADFSFNCSSLACTFDAAPSTDDHGIASYAWAFGDAGNGSGGAPGHGYAASGTYTVTLTVTDSGGLTATRSRRVSVNGAPAAAAESFFSLPPCRIFDSRNTTILSSGTNRTIPTAGSCGIPADAKAVSVNVTVVAPTGAGFLLLQPGNLPAAPYAVDPPVHNFDPATSPRANNAVVRLATDGSGALIATPFVAGSPGQVHLVVDVSGYFSEAALASPGAQGPLRFQTATPCRVADTRASAPLVAAVPRTFSIQGVCAVPAGAVAAQVNLTAIQPSSTGHLVLYPSNLSIPATGSLNFNAGVAALANGVRTPLAATTPDVALVYAAGSGGATVHATLDVGGYFVSGTGLQYHPVAPCRAVDTRNADQGGPALAGGESRSFQVRGNCGIPPTAKAAAINLISVGSTGAGFLAAYPDGTALPGTANLNFDPSLGAIGNGTVVALGTAANDLALTAGASGTDVIVDVFGYFE